MTRHTNGPNFDRHHHHCRNYPDAGECNDTEVDSELTFSRNFTKSGQLADQLPNRGQQLPLTRDARPGPRRVRSCGPEKLRPRSLRRNCRKCGSCSAEAQVVRMRKGDLGGNWTLKIENCHTSQKIATNPLHFDSWSALVLVNRWGFFRICICILICICI